jgi:uncharacterized protein (TIGR04222 family)
MDWLIDNPIAKMYGPHFLIFYSIVVAITLYISWRRVRNADWTATTSLPPIPSTFDPYELAYLRGGENEVTRATIFALLQKEFLIIKDINKEQYIEQTSPNPDRHQLSTIERRVYDWFTTRRTTKDIFGTDGLASHLKPFCNGYEQRLQSERLLTPNEVKRISKRTFAIGALVIIGLGSYKFTAAIINGFYNVFLLMIIGGAGLFILIQICNQPRMSNRGVQYLKRLQLAFENLKSVPNTTSPIMGAVDPTLLLIGLFGIGAIADAAYDPYRQMFNKASSSGGCGASSCSSGCGSSCGSSCGGGGCGGCGGGGD